MKKLDIWQTEREKAEVIGNLKVLKEGNEDRCYLKIWRGKATKPMCNYYFKSMELREKYIKDAIEGENKRQTEKEKRNLARKGSPEQLDQVKPGTIFCSSWGYDQTNIDFYQVISVKGQFAVIREIGQIMLEQTGFMSENVIADPDSFKGEPMKKKIQFSQGKPYLTLNSYSCCGLWDGRSKNQSHYA